MKKLLKTRMVKQVVVFKAPPKELYEMLMDSKRHAAFSGSSAKMGRRVGSAFTAYGGWIKGRNLKLIPDRLIVQSWRGEDWPKGHYSKAMFLFTKAKGSTKLTFSQTGVPLEKYRDISKGWRSEYWGKMKKALKKGA